MKNEVISKEQIRSCRDLSEVESYLRADDTVEKDTMRNRVAGGMMAFPLLDVLDAALEFVLLLRKTIPVLLELLHTSMHEHNPNFSVLGSVEGIRRCRSMA